MAGKTDESDTVGEVDPPAIVDDISGTVHWIGYVYKLDKSLVNVEIVTKNNPQFDLYQELNRAKQKELVVRFYKSHLRRKLQRDIDASEFRSPVAYIRTRDNSKGIVEVVMTLRDDVEAKYLAKDGGVLLSFPIPGHYFGDAAISGDPVGKAVDLSSPLSVSAAEDSSVFATFG